MKDGIILGGNDRDINLNFGDIIIAIIILSMLYLNKPKNNCQE